ncbi:MAG TPA: penicillin-binding transpeptidase domain-containing protein [Polyangiales bacterium]|nr:penicillin-binding transpeptidase domain-containing protein [Polyangiales bacterium]
MKNPIERRRRNVRARVYFLTALLSVSAGAILCQAYHLQVERAPELRERAEDQSQRAIKVAPKRGAIFDRDGAPLALSIDVDSVSVSPSAMLQAKQDPAFVAQKLGELLGVDGKALHAKILAAQSDPQAKSRHYISVKRQVTTAQGKAVRSLALGGVTVYKEPRRYYPNRELAAQLLGFANVDGTGIEGVELMLEEQLRGSMRQTPALLDGRRKVVYSEGLLDQRAAQGNAVTLTIDKEIQALAERELEQAVRMSEAHSGSIVVLDPGSGELLAIANYPLFNANEPSKSPTWVRRNRALTDRFEPGSTVKPFTLAGALAKSAIVPSSKLDCENGQWRVGGKTIRDVHPYRILTPAEILQHSSNICTAKIGLSLGYAGLHRAFTSFGFGEPTGLGLSGETGGVLKPWKNWYEIEAATIAFGQAMSASTLQLAMAMGAIANHGRLMEPTLVKRIVDADGHVVLDAAPKVRRQAVPENVAALVTDMLVGVTEEGGTGTKAAIDGYMVAGKTGTAQKAEAGGYSKTRWTSSFIGYAPAQAPRLLVAVVIDEPMVAHQGGQVAAPTFRNVMAGGLRQLGVPSEKNATLAEVVKARRAQQGAPAEAPSLSQGEVPLLAAGTDEPSTPPSARGELSVPNLIGQTARAAVQRAHQAQFDVRLTGSGVVVGQDPPARSRALPGSQLNLRLGTPSERAAVANDNLEEHAEKRSARGGRDG